MAEAMEGDPKYLAPELLQGRFGKPADIFRWAPIECPAMHSLY